jgi:sialic acid synthase SpsE
MTAGPPAPERAIRPKTISFGPPGGVGSIAVGDGQPCCIVAEIGQNHNGDLGIARKLIDMAALCGASAVKFQKRDVDGELSVELRDKPYDNENSFGATYGEHRRFLEFSAEQHRELQAYTAGKGILYLCTVCDLVSLEEMAPLDLPAYKVASRDMTNWPLLAALGRLGRPIVLSTGMGAEQEVDQALELLSRYHDQFILLQCTSEYPCPTEHVNLRAMQSYRRRYGCLVGMSDHTAGIMPAIAAAVLGACYVEKHITLSRAMRGSDHAGSLEMEGLRRVVSYIRQVEIAMGDGSLGFKPWMGRARDKLAKSLSSKRDLEAGDVLREEDLELRCPGSGVPWPRRECLVGKRARRSIAKHTILAPGDFE